MELTLREERPGDEAAIDAVNSRAFGSMCEANIVRLMRAHHPSFEARFSITAWLGGDLVGHALFTPAEIRLLGRAVRALALGPIGVVPERQKRGIGSRLLDYGHELGRRSGYSLVFLNGHPSYYPRFGYRPCFGFAGIDIDTGRLPAPKLALTPLPVHATDVPWLEACAAREWANVDFGWVWGSDKSAWAFPPVNAAVLWSDDGRRAAYALQTPDKGCRLLLADDVELARAALATLRPRTLEQHPSGWLAQNVVDASWGRAHAGPHDAAMAYELEPGVLEACLRAQQGGARPAGFALFPLPFLIC